MITAADLAMQASAWASQFTDSVELLSLAQAVNADGEKSGEPVPTVVRTVPGLIIQASGSVAFDSNAAAAVTDQRWTVTLKVDANLSGIVACRKAGTTPALYIYNDNLDQSLRRHTVLTCGAVQKP
jgi:hypothetical protein